MYGSTKEWEMHWMEKHQESQNSNSLDYIRPIRLCNVVGWRTVSPIPDKRSILGQIPWFVECVRGSKFVTDVMSWQIRVSLQRRVGCESRHGGEDSKSFDLQLSTSPPVFVIIFSKFVIIFVSWQLLAAEPPHFLIMKTNNLIKLNSINI